MCEVALLNTGQFLEENSSERLLLSTLPATGRMHALLLRGRIWVVPYSLHFTLLGSKFFI